MRGWHYYKQFQNRLGEVDRHILLRRLRTTIAAMVPGQSPAVLKLVLHILGQGGARFMYSWATTEADVDALLADVREVPRRG